MMRIGERRSNGASLRIEHFQTPGLTDDDAKYIKQLTSLRTEPERRRLGDARWLMCQTVLEADRERTILILEPNPDADSGLNKEQLIAWYRNFRFKVIQEGEGLITLMSRVPAGR